VKHKLGKDLKVGDTIGVWWSGGRDRITRLTPYRGPLEYLWENDGGARIADFAVNRTGMTIEPGEVFEVF